MKKILFTLMICAMGATLAACSKKAEESVIETLEQAEEGVSTSVIIEHSMGTTEVPVNPQKIVALDLAALDILDALGLGDRVTGIPKKSSVSYLTSYVEDEGVANMGSVKEVDMEALNSLQPDLILIGGRLASEYDNIYKIAPTISVSIDHKQGFMNSFNKNLHNIAAIFGLKEKADEYYSGFEARLEAIKKAAEGKSAIVSLVTSGSLSTLGNDSRCSVITNEAGFKNVAEEIDSTHGDTASFELLLDKDPDYIFVLDRDTAINSEGAKVAKEVMDNEIVQKTSAYQNDTIVYLTPDVWYLSEGGITATDIMLKDLEQGLHVESESNVK